MRILIADDEHLARVTVLSMLNEIDNTFEVLEVRNGKDLIKKALVFIPHVIIVDIQMPLVNGLDAMKRVKDRLPMTKWIILTGFAQFAYAKEAVILHAYNYLLKPIPFKHLNDIILQANTEIIQEIGAVNAAFEQRLQAFLQLPDQSSLELSYFQVALICIDENEDGLPCALSHMITNAQKILVDDFEILARGAVIPLDEKVCCIIGGSQDRNILENLFVPALWKIHHRFSASRWVVFDAVQKGSGTIISSLDRCKEACFLKAFLSQKECLDVLSVQLLPNTVILVSIANSLQQAWLNKCQGRVLYAKELIESAVVKSRELPEINKNELYHLLCYLHRFVQSKYPLSPDEVSYQRINMDLDDFLHLLYDNSSTQVNTIISYIKNHYSEAISVKGIASILRISPNYLSAKFRQETGKRFVEYVSEIRIDQAKLRLTHTQMQINEISNAVGIHDVRYFSDLFRKYESCTPSEYRARTTK